MMSMGKADNVLCSYEEGRGKPKYVISLCIS